MLWRDLGHQLAHTFYCIGTVAPASLSDDGARPLHSIIGSRPRADPGSRRPLRVADAPSCGSAGGFHAWDCFMFSSVSLDDPGKLETFRCPRRRARAHACTRVRSPRGPAAGGPSCCTAPHVSADWTTTPIQDAHSISSAGLIIPARARNIHCCTRPAGEISGRRPTTKRWRRSICCRGWKHHPALSPACHRQGDGARNRSGKGSSDVWFNLSAAPSTRYRRTLRNIFAGEEWMMTPLSSLV